jgi:hypothetical protein
MTTRFDYINCTIKQLVDFIKVSSSQKISLSLIYHIKHGNDDIVEKILSPREVVKKRKLIKQLEGM